MFDYDSIIPLKGVNFIFNILRTCMINSRLHSDWSLKSSLDEVIKLIEIYSEINNDCKLSELLRIYRNKLSLLTPSFTLDNLLSLDKIIGFSCHEVALRHELLGTERINLFQKYLKKNAKKIVEVAFISEFKKLRLFYQ